MSAGDLRDVLSSLRGFCKKREDGTSKTYIVEKLKKEEASGNLPQGGMGMKWRGGSAMVKSGTTSAFDKLAHTANKVSAILSTPVDDAPPPVNWDKLFKTGTLNIDEHYENLRDREERARELREYGRRREERKDEDKGGGRVSPKDPFAGGFGHRRKSMVQGMEKINNLMVELKLSPPTSPTKELERTILGPLKPKVENSLMPEEKEVANVGPPVEETIPLPRKKKKKKDQPKPPAPSEIRAAKKKELLDLILPAVLNSGKKKKRKKRKVKKPVQPHPDPYSHSSFSSTLPNFPQHPEVDEESLMNNYKPAFSSSVKVRGSHNVKYKHKTKKVAGAKNQQQRQPQQRQRQEVQQNTSHNPYSLNARPSHYTKPSFLAPSSTNAMKLQAMRERKLREKEEKKKEEEMKLAEEQARKRGVKLQSVDHLLENFNDIDDDLLERSTDSDYAPPTFTTLEEAKIHYERKQLERQSDQLLSPLKQPKVKKAGKKKKNKQPTLAAIKPSPKELKESNDLLDAMDDLLYQITVLKQKLNVLSLSPNATAEEKEENDDLLSCLLVVATHINKHKEILESGALATGSRPSHVSILESAQTWRLTLLSVIDALANRPQTIEDVEPDQDLQNLHLNLTLSSGKTGDEVLEAISPSKNKSKSHNNSRAFSSPIDKIADESARQRILLKIVDGIFPSFPSSPKHIDPEKDDIVKKIKALHGNSPSGPPIHVGGLIGGQASSPLPGLASLGIFGL